MIPVKINNEPYNIPDNWSDITMGQYMEMSDHRNNLNACRLLSIFTGIDYKELLNYDLTLFEQDIIPIIGMLNDDLKLSELPCPDKITIGGKVLDVPKDIKIKTFGQKVILQTKINIVSESNGDTLKLIPFAVANYLQPIHDEAPYDDKRAEEFEKDILACPVTEAYPVGNFFLTRLKKSVE